MSESIKEMHDSDGGVDVNNPRLIVIIFQVTKIFFSNVVCKLNFKMHLNDGVNHCTFSTAAANAI